MSYQCEDARGCDNKATYHSDNDHHYCDDHVGQAIRELSPQVWRKRKKVVGPPENKENSNPTHNPERDVICLDHEYNKQCEACVDWVCGSQPCLLNRKLSPVS